MTDLFFSSQRGQEAGLVPNSCCLTPTSVRDKVKPLESDFLQSSSHLSVFLVSKRRRQP